MRLLKSVKIQYECFSCLCFKLNIGNLINEKYIVLICIKNKNITFYFYVLIFQINKYQEPSESLIPRVFGSYNSHYVNRKYIGHIT